MTDPTPPTIFGKPMVRQEYDGPELHVLSLGGADVCVAVCQDSESDEWVATLEGVSPLSRETPDNAARAIEVSLRSLVLSLAPLLDPDAKREVAAALGIHRAPPWHETPPGEDETEPIL
jgi:hypothetical protein